MTRQDVYNLLVRAKRPIDFFGKVIDLKELKKKYLEFAKLIHPDTATNSEKYISNQGFSLLQTIYKQGQEELNNGIYEVIKEEDLYARKTPMFDIKIHKKKYEFYECIYNGEISDIYKGLCDGQLVCMKFAIDENDNDLLKLEYDTLSKYSHQSFPIVRDFIKVNDKSAIIMDEIKGEPLVDIMERNPHGLNPEVVMWVMERLFSAIGYLHSNFIVHENLCSDNIIINKENHNVSITGFSFHIPNANQKDAHYQIKNDYFSAKEVDKNAIVRPQSDIYSLGRLAIYMLSGNKVSLGMPITIDERIRSFIRKMIEEDVNKRPSDAWKLWDEWIDIRKKVYGDEHFKNIDF